MLRQESKIMSCLQIPLFSAEILGIYRPGYHVLSGEQMDALQPHELDDVIERVSNTLGIIFRADRNIFNNALRYLNFYFSGWCMQI